MTNKYDTKTKIQNFIYFCINSNNHYIQNMKNKVRKKVLKYYSS